MSWRNLYGALYNWYSVNNASGLCPTGWHVPGYAEWTTLTNFAGGESVAGGKLKSTRTAPTEHPRWDSPNTEATDQYGFSALPGGYRGSNGNFGYVGSSGLLWSATEYSSTNVWYRSMTYEYGSVFRPNSYKTYGFSVRCVRDQ
ncbi:MAG: fibrobacter succinogenes major paralogous domain-containing protein [Bacteroidales bacterium]|nr:fibrobacter succinogenes major paralogous domain-containing protein [Bacteroidales bacterium]